MKSYTSLHLLLILFIGVAFAFDQSTPTFEASDEAWHYGVVREIAAGRGLPVQRVGELTTYRQEGSQPPLYYFVGAALVSWIDNYDSLSRYSYNPFGQVGVPGTTQNVNMFRHTSLEEIPLVGVSLAVHVIRWFSILLGCGTVALSFFIAKTLFPEKGRLPILAASFTAFNPMFVFISASVNNDNGVWFLASLIIYILILTVNREGDISLIPSWLPKKLLQRQYVTWLLGALLGLAILTKLSALLLIPVISTYLIWRTKYHGSWYKVFREGSIIALCVFVLTSWWFYRNWIIYGELLGTATMAEMYGFVRTVPPTWDDLILEWRGWWYSLWGIFGAFNIIPGKWFFAIINGLVMIAVSGGIASIVRRYPSGVHINQIHARHVLAVTFILTTLIGNVYWSLNQHAAQGRLAIIAVTVLSTYLGAGMLSLVGEHLEKLLSNVLVMVLLVVSLLIVNLYISPSYKVPEYVTQEEIPSDMIVSGAAFNDEIELVGYSVLNNTITVEDSVQITFYWRGKSSMDIDYKLAINVYGNGMKNIAKIDTWPGGGLLPTGEWEPGLIYPDTYVLPIIGLAEAPTVMRMGLSFWDDDLANPLPISLGDIQIESLMIDIGRLMPTDAINETPKVEDGSVFDSGIKLLGYTISQYEASEISFTLYWQAERKIGGDLTVFVHLIDSLGNIVAQADGPPANGYWPTSAWEPGMLVFDHHNLVHGINSFRETHTLVIGLYDPASGVRVPAYSSTGVEWNNWAVPIRTIGVSAQ
jgi:4-amino-4-deoxy-L-arabinose transferase-like glycosyltransferase